MSAKVKWAVAVVAVGLLTFPVAAQAIVAYVKNPQHPVVYTAAGSGDGVRKLGPGSNPHLFFGGVSVVYLYEGRGGQPAMKIANANAGPSRTLMTGWREPQYVDFHKELIAALRGSELGKRELVVIDGSGMQRVLDSGYFSGLSFCPNCAEPQLVYSKSAEEFPLHSDVYTVAIDGGSPVRLTDDNRSLAPLWGRSQIVFVKQLAENRLYGPKNELFLMSADGSGVRRLTHTPVGPLAEGLFPTEWSNDGRHLLAEFEGQDIGYAVAVNPRTGAQRPVGATGEEGFVGTDLSSDGKTVLGYTGGLEPGPGHDVATIPFGGGRTRIKVPDAFEPSWAR